jgi:sterol 3beta-glucosyltransferase
MKIVVAAIGSRGDVQPYIALCQGLIAAGHNVILATNPTLCDLVASYRVEAAPVGPPVDMGLEGAKLWAKSGNNMLSAGNLAMAFTQALNDSEMRRKAAELGEKIRREEDGRQVAVREIEAL